MPGTQANQNPFLRKLLQLQQDGSGAISAPTNWTRYSPLLEVKTELDEIVAELAESCVGSASRGAGRWHFFIGSPGNGKSAAVGQLVRKLLEDRGCAIKKSADNDEDPHAGVDIRELPDDLIPYSLDVFEAGNDKYPSMRIVQDASVVRNPYAPDVDPAKDLLETLSNAWERGISLVVCTNRGVQEKAFHDTYRDPKINQLPWHKAIMRPLVESANDSGPWSKTIENKGQRAVFSSIRATASFLDNRSLILSGRGIFDNIIRQATKGENWATCRECANALLCPFKANRDWLDDAKGRELVIQAFRRAEVFSAQVIVFREALAAVSFLLAGCACDYQEVGHPCGWVGERVARGDLFGLAARRVYMALYSSDYPRGLESDKKLRDDQLEALDEILAKMSGGTALKANAKRALEAALDKDLPAPSTDVGIPRLLGSDGFFSRLDAIRGPLPALFYDKWDGNYDGMSGYGSPFISVLEQQCLATWDMLENAAENVLSHRAAEAYWAVRRWSTQFTLHLGALVEGRAIDDTYVDDFTKLLELLWKSRDQRSGDEFSQLHQLKEQIEKDLNRNTGQEDGPESVALADNVWARGRWLLSDKMRPEFKASPASGSLTIAVHFGGSPSYTTLAAPMYAWLRRRANDKLDSRCIPDDLLSEAMDAKGRAVAKGEYAVARDDIQLVILHSHEDGKCEKFTLTRYEGEVVVDVQPQP